MPYIHIVKCLSHSNPYVDYDNNPLPLFQNLSKISDDEVTKGILMSHSLVSIYCLRPLLHVLRPDHDHLIFSSKQKMLSQVSVLLFLKMETSKTVKPRLLLLTKSSAEFQFWSSVERFTESGIQMCVLVMHHYQM